jgi:GNAT superfamily N-acetyltransferase
VTALTDVARADPAPTVRRFARPDWPWVRRWFEDETLDRELGPLDTEWLEHVLAERDGVELVVEDGAGSPVALVGVVWDPDGAEHAITDLAVAPDLRRTGVGRTALTEVLGWAGHPPTTGWIAFVDPENAAAFAFFTALGWAYQGVDGEMHRFHRAV